MSEVHAVAAIFEAGAYRYHSSTLRRPSDRPSTAGQRTRTSYGGVILEKSTLDAHHASNTCSEVVFLLKWTILPCGYTQAV